MKRDLFNQDGKEMRYRGVWDIQTGWACPPTLYLFSSAVVSHFSS